MFPIYSGMNSHPHQRNHVPCTQYYHPNWEGVSPQVKEDPPSSPSMREPWLHNYGYPVPMQCHNCCTYGQHPAYYNFRPPCSYFTSPPAYNHFCGSVPSYPLTYPQSYPVYYAPPPHYSMELPRYEYEKSEPRDQYCCCECPNHRCHVKGRNDVKIEEQEPDVETKKGDSLFPAGAYSFPHPYLWIPPGYAMNKEQPRRLVENEANEQKVLPYEKKPHMQQRSLETETQDNQGSVHGRKPHDQSVQLSERHPHSRYGWFPLDMNSIKQLMEGGDPWQTSNQENRSRDANKDCDVENKDQNKEFSYPMIWMPYNGRMGNGLKGQEDKTAGGTTAEELSSSKVVPKKLEHADNKAEKGRTKEGDDDNRNGTLGADKKKIVKTIPVKQLDECNVDRAPVTNASHDSVKNGTGRQLSSPTKKSKLPPICLRVDPPKKKNGNGSSRSPIPPGEKNEHPHKEMKVKNVETPSQNKIEVSQGVGEAEQGSEISEDKIASAERKLVEQDKPEDAKSGDDSVQAQEPQATLDGEFQQESRKERRVMSETEASIIIQSAYRAYHVRRWEPLKKLKQISKVHEEAIQVKRHAEDLESRATVDFKQKAAMGEIIMNLLLKLDTIQGPHQTIRDVRRYVAKELILLQEKLDSIVSQKSTTAQGAEESPKDSDLVEGSECIVEDLKEPPHDSSLDGDKSTKASEEDGTISNDLASSLPSPCQDVVCCSENKDTSGEVVVNMESQRGREGEPVVSSPSSGGVTGLSLIKKEPDVNETLGENTPPSIDLVLRAKDQEANLLSELTQKVVNDLATARLVEEESLLPELPQEVGEDSLANVSRVEDTAVQNDTVVTNEDQAADTLFELPREDKKDEEESLLSKLPREVSEDSLANVSSVEDTAVQNDTVVTNEDQAADNLFELPREDKKNEEESLLSELPQEVGEDSLANVSSVEDTAMQNDTVVTSEDQAADTFFELPREDKKDVPLSVCDLDSSRCASPCEEQPRQDASPASQIERMEQEADLQINLPVDGEELARFDTTSNSKEDQEKDQCNETLSGQDTEIVNSPVRIELPVMKEVESKLKETTGKREAVFEAPSEENKDDVMKEGLQMSNVECTSRTTSLGDPFSGDQENESETVQVDLVRTVVPEPYVRQSKEEYRADEDQTDKKILEENEKLKQLLEKLLASGKEQQDVISNLNGEVKDLEKKLARKKRLKSAKHPRVKVSRPTCRKLANGF